MLAWLGAWAGLDPGNASAQRLYSGLTKKYWYGKRIGQNNFNSRSIVWADKSAETRFSPASADSGFAEGTWIPSEVFDPEELP